MFFAMNAYFKFPGFRQMPVKFPWTISADYWFLVRFGHGKITEF